ncbi:MAG: alpha/beta fold hydrolase [Gammaproteobacteria bacterium]|nr:alpha/beta fold hydrolase [Gammaproteobacteria bacterium]
MSNPNISRRYLASICLIISALIVAPVAAKTVELSFDNKRVVTAEFSQGGAEAPAIIILHGFLQTREFHTVMRIYNALSESGYSVLAPTLSLGLNRRQKSLACEAIHFHSMETDLAEIDLWVRWLNKETGKKVILLGHSAGSVQLVAYVDQFEDAPVAQGIYISLGHFGRGIGSAENPVDYQRAVASIKKGNTGLEKYAMSYCKEYLTTPQNYASYYEWGKEKILSALNKNRIPLHVIYGSKDQRIDKSWMKKIEASGLKVISIEGANHFFVSEYEFDLQDAIDNILPGM